MQTGRRECCIHERCFGNGHGCRFRAERLVTRRAACNGDADSRAASGRAGRQAGNLPQATMCYYYSQFAGGGRRERARTARRESEDALPCDVDFPRPGEGCGAGWEEVTTGPDEINHAQRADDVLLLEWPLYWRLEWLLVRLALRTETAVDTTGLGGLRRRWGGKVATGVGAGV
jgi:hypothetical protein